MRLGQPRQILDAAAGFGPVDNLLACGDPDVRFVDGQWVMYLGAAYTTGGPAPAGVNIFTARLPVGAALSSDAWVFDTEPGAPNQARPLIEPAGPGAFDEWLHTPCRVRGDVPGVAGPVDRIYYTGSAGDDADASTRRMAIGALERDGETWRRAGGPVLSGDADRGTLLEPKVVHADRRWRMWYQATDHEAGPGEVPDCEIRYVESVDGLTGWSQPVTVFGAGSDNWFDAAVTALPDGRFHLVAARAPNLFGGAVEGLGPQGLWSYTGEAASGRRRDWSDRPRPLLDAENGAAWYAGGTYGPCAVVDPAAARPTLQVFFTGSAPPEPRPYVLSVGRLEVPLDEL